MKQIILAAGLFVIAVASRAEAKTPTYYAELAYAQANSNSQSGMAKNMQYFPEVESYVADGSGYIERFVGTTGFADITDAINLANATTAACNKAGNASCVDGNSAWSVELLTIRYQH